jgi:hypothetical protein
MKHKYKLIRVPASPLRFRMIERGGWRSQINLSALTNTEFEYNMWFGRFTCNTQIKNSYINCKKFQIIKFDKWY